jgi:drug/metabolite transporter (DMT)-like permease
VSLDQPRAATGVAGDQGPAASPPARVIPWAGIGYLLVVYVVWGSTYLAIRVAVREGAGFPPFTLGALRVLVAGGVILLWAAASGRSLRLTRREALVLAGSGLLLWVGGNGLVVWAEQRAESSYAAVLVSSAPVWVALLQAALDRRAPSALLVGALLVGLAGVALLAAPALAAGSAVDALGAIALILAAVTWAIGSVLQRRHPVSVPPLVSAGYQLLFGAVGLGLAALVAHEPVPTPTTEAWIAWGYLVVFGSLLGFTSYIQMLHLLPTSIAFTYAYVNPVIAVVLGALVLGEAITPWMLGGMALVLLGVAGVFQAQYRGRSEPRGRSAR